MPAPEAVDLGAQRVVFELAWRRLTRVGERVLQLERPVAARPAAGGEVQALGSEGFAVSGGQGAPNTRGGSSA